MCILGNYKIKPNTLHPLVRTPLQHHHVTCLDQYIDTMFDFTNVASSKLYVQ